MIDAYYASYLFSVSSSEAHTDIYLTRTPKKMNGKKFKKSRKGPFDKINASVERALRALQT